MEVLTLNDFYEQLANTGIRLEHQFQVQFFPESSALSQEAIDFLKASSFFAESVNVPGKIQNSTDIKYLRFNLNIPTTVEYKKTINLSFRLDAENKLRTNLLNWMNYASNIPLENGLRANLVYGGGVKRIPNSSIQLGLLDETLSKTVQTYTLHGAYPADIGDMSMNNSSGEAAKFDTVFNYQYFTVA